MSYALSREMQMDRQEFLRELPKAMGDLSYEVVGNKVIAGSRERRIEITMTDEGVRKLGSLNLPMEQIDLDFVGYAQEEIEAFMADFDRHTMRLGQ
jgi:hypothetical protein